MQAAPSWALFCALVLSPTDADEESFEGVDRIINCSMHCAMKLGSPKSRCVRRMCNIEISAFCFEFKGFLRQFDYAVVFLTILLANILSYV